MTYDQRYRPRDHGDAQSQPGKTPGRTTQVAGAYGDPQGPAPLADTKPTGDPNMTVLASGFDPMVPTSELDASGGDGGKIAAYFDRIVKEFYDQPAQQASHSAARAKQLTAGARFKADYDAQVGAGNQAAVVTTARQWNAAVRGAAIERVVGSYLAIPVTLPGGVPITFRTPYNINDKVLDKGELVPGPEAGGPNLGKNSPQQMAAEAQKKINSGGLEPYLPARAKGQTIAMQIAQLAGAPGGKDTLSGAVTNMCRMARIGVDCAGFVFHVVDQTDKLLGGAGWPTSQVTASTFGANAMTDDTWSREVKLREVAAGDVLRFEPGGHHIGIVKSAAATPAAVQLVLAHSNEQTYFDAADGVFVGAVELPFAIESDIAAQGAKIKAAVPSIMGTNPATGVASSFAGFRRFSSSYNSGKDKQFGSPQFA